VLSYPKDKQGFKFGGVDMLIFFIKFGHFVLIESTLLRTFNSLGTRFDPFC